MEDLRDLLMPELRAAVAARLAAGTDPAELTSSLGPAAEPHTHGGAQPHSDIRLRDAPSNDSRAKRGGEERL